MTNLSKHSIMICEGYRMVVNQAHLRSFLGNEDDCVGLEMCSLSQRGVKHISEDVGHLVREQFCKDW